MPKITVSLNCVKHGSGDHVHGKLDCTNKQDQAGPCSPPTSTSSPPNGARVRLFFRS
jgi:hypothetical protein